jgi:hypothetical protein
MGLLVLNIGELTNGVPRADAYIVKRGYQNVVFTSRRASLMTSLVIKNWSCAVGVFYDRPQSNTVFDLMQNPPTTTQQTLFFVQVKDVGSGQVLLAPPSLVAIDREGKIPTTYAYNLGVQYKLPFKSVMDLSYVGTSGQHLLQRRSINAPPYGAAYLAQNQDPTAPTSATAPGARALPVDLPRPYQGFGQIQYIEPSTSSNYHSLQASLNRRFRRGLLLGVNYTWSKALGTQSNDLPGIIGFGAPHTLDNRRANYGLLDFDRRNNFSVNWVYELSKATESRSLGYALNDTTRGALRILRRLRMEMNEGVNHGQGGERRRLPALAVADIY